MKSDEAHRAACEARYVLALRHKGRWRVDAYLKEVRLRRSDEAAKVLEKAAAALWKAEQQRREDK